MTTTAQAGIQFSLTTDVQLQFWGLGVSLGTEIMGRTGYQGSWASGTTSVYRSSQQATFSKIASVHVAYEGIDPQFSYWVTPFVVRVQISLYGSIIVRVNLTPFSQTRSTWLPILMVRCITNWIILFNLTSSLGLSVGGTKPMLR